MPTDDTAAKTDNPTRRKERVAITAACLQNVQIVGMPGEAQDNAIAMRAVDLADAVIKRLDETEG